MTFKNILAVIGISAATAVGSVWGYGKYVQYQTAGTQDPSKVPVNYAGFFNNSNAPVGPVDFTQAAAAATPAVVHIKTKTKAKQISNNLPRRSNPFGDFFGDDMFGDMFGNQQRVIPEQRASGSGVLISEDGYIVTNNHVVEGADEINVTLPNRKSYKATVIGTDPSSDIAVIKIDGHNFPYLVYGNSDDTKVGQWVLAIGYPLNLDVTVSAGIISAKSRSIGINSRDGAVKNAVESFIQTDAAVNPGNSGGALINTNGELIGINSAIASGTGYYAGVSYAIPVNITKKVVADIIKYGTVQRAYIGISYANGDLTDEQKKQEGIKDGDGVYVLDVPEGGAAKIAGIKKGDFITKINNVKVATGPEMVEQVSRFKPGDKITITYTRDGKENTVGLTLKNKAGNVDIVKNQNIIEKLGAEFDNVDGKTAKANEISGGVVIKKINDGALKQSRIQEGFIITAVNGTSVKNIDDFKSALANVKGTVYLDGIYPGYTETYRYPVKINED
ncbi:MAG: trypsin-like peptidase domain-containing protein [Bacteroidetes bacterium]|nr:trypsin-like peptidase domain-containing protein [Bacteroidota bacterium]MBS1592141.1 trypsin-like peptidase domain-containing protein [Bacteroidota bacterium]MBS1641459.1 trypsin-like peptidase domain-containing protein [Bacteroidota bacterium]MBS1671692.1 trypsin-like peptidase domain-containing protein [Bacteroidota bacterium]